MFDQQVPGRTLPAFRKINLTFTLTQSWYHMKVFTSYNNCAQMEVTTIAEPSIAGFLQQTEPAGHLTTELTYRDSGGYLEDDMPDMLAILPPPPREDSFEWELDQALSRMYLSVDKSRKAQAVKDAVLQFPMAVDAFNPVLDIRIDQHYTPVLYKILQRTCVDGGRSTGKAKRNYQRNRPFMENQQPTLTPWDEDMLRSDGSYPSGHTAIGWIWTLILRKLFPSKAAQIVNRGYHFGISRSICNVHWFSDIAAGRSCGNEVMKSLLTSPEFLHDLSLARKEISRSNPISFPK